MYMARSSLLARTKSRRALDSGSEKALDPANVSEHGFLDEPPDSQWWSKLRLASAPVHDKLALVLATSNLSFSRMASSRMGSSWKRVSRSALRDASADWRKAMLSVRERVLRHIRLFECV